VSELNFFNRTIPILAERESICVLLPRQLTNIILRGQNTTIAFEVSYYASTQQRNQIYKYDVSIYKELAIRSETDDTLRKAVEEGIKSLNSTLVNNQRETNSRLEWATMLNPVSGDSNPTLQAMLNTFYAAWSDFKFLNERASTAFSDDEFSDYTMRVLCEQLYHRLCAQAGEEYKELRHTLLRMARYDYCTNEEYISLGDAAAVFIEQHNEDRFRVTDLPVSSPWG
jgi:hypothetical protein